MNSGGSPVTLLMNSQNLLPLTRFSLVRMLPLAAFALLMITCNPALGESRLNRQAPAFELADSGGQLLRFPDDLGGPAIVLFWASWCPYCKALMPHLQSIVDEYRGEIQVLALNFRDDEDPRVFISEMGFDFRLFPESDPVAERWGVKATPGLFLVDASGRVLFSNYAIAQDEYPADGPDTPEKMKHYQKAARKAPYWAARLRSAIDKTKQ